MRKRRQAIRLRADEDRLLRMLYVEFRIPRDQYPRRPGDLERFTRTWNALSGRSDSSDDVLHYIFVQQKSGRKCKHGYWPTFDGNHERMPSDLVVHFSAREWQILESIYVDLQIASDGILLDPEVGDRVARQFAERTGRIVPPLVLCASVVTRRKDGLLPTLRPKADESDLDFRDIDDIATAS